MAATQRVVLVTGGGTGIGAAVARRFARDGFAVGLAGRRREPLEAVAGSLPGAAVRVIAADVSVPDGADVVVASVVSAFGGLDVLVCNHGVGESAAVGDDSPDGWDATMRINLTGPFLLARAALPHLIERRGAIVNVSSTNAWQAGPGWASYCASKAGLNMLTRCLAADYGPRGVRANAVCPGWVRTPMGDQDMAAVADAWGTDVEHAYRLCTRDSPLRRPAEPDEVAAVVAFLAGPDASYVNGVEIAVDGGAMAVDASSTAMHGPDPLIRELLASSA
ncbi:MAG TPA: SDR family oxidoreductase [Gaiellales bacterium]|jgi:NAD(P)-dependent dehydrogenase (short-subunit alcohol dehydrogenase family)|nr:SDR family oxidoreductase [Gaiellales bacterium]